MKYTTVIYFGYIPLTVKIWNDLYMNAVMNEGIRVEYWDLSRLFFNSSYGQEDASSLLNVCVKHFATYPELETYIKQQDAESTLFVSTVTYDYIVTKLFQLFTKYNCQLAVFARNMFPRSSFMDRNLFQKLMSLSPAKIIRYYKNRRAIHWKETGKIRGYNVIFQGGSHGYKGIGCISRTEIEQAQRVKVNSNDYDTYLRIRDLPPRQDEKHIVFLDQYLPLHPDTKLLNIHTITPEKYYSELNAYFSHVETQYGIPVIIAAHPKALLYKKNDYFCGRRVEFSRSAELVRDAEFVLAHNSTSIAFAVAFRKRLHLLTSHTLERDMAYVHRNVMDEASFLGCNWQYVDEDSPALVAEVDDSRYNQYKYDYLCWPETELLATQDIIIDFLKQ